MTKINERLRLLALAKLETGLKPKEVADETGLSYSQVLKLGKDLAEAKRRDDLESLFNLDELVLQELLDAVKGKLSESVDLVLGDTTTLEGVVENTAKSITAADVLNNQMQETASELVKQIAIQAKLATSADTIYTLAESLAKLQTSFFAKGTNVQINNFSEGSGFERHLKD